jgi:putative ABC transport system ATP-binding protein
MSAENGKGKRKTENRKGSADNGPSKAESRNNGPSKTGSRNNGSGKTTKEPEAQRGNIIKLRQVSKAYHRAKEKLQVLDGLDLDVEEGAFEALMGPSGSGKTTLLNIVAGLDNASSGSVTVAGSELTQMTSGQRGKWRASNVGFIFQTYNMMPVLTALENVELPLLLTNLSAKERKERAQTALRVVGLADRSAHYPRQLSGGQEQRVTVARAIVGDPKLIVADEPTGDLDRASADEILALLVKLNTEFKKSILMVTHDPAAARCATRVHQLDKGRLLDGS